MVPLSERLARIEQALQEVEVTAPTQIQAMSLAKLIQKSQGRFKAISDQFPGMPWEFVGLTCLEEANLSFSRHLANGDSLFSDTVNEPKGIMAKYKPGLKAPFTWEDAAWCGLHDFQVGWGHVSFEDKAHLLNALEEWNGLGYWGHGILSPYLWAGTNQYVKGKFRSDGVWDSEEVSQQVGAVAILKALEALS